MPLLNRRLASRASSTPFIPFGITTSLNKRSNSWPLSNIWMASAPFRAQRTRYPNVVSIADVTSRISSLSSTTRIRSEPPGMSCVWMASTSASGFCVALGRYRATVVDGLIAEEVSDLREDWMEHADRVLADEQIVAAVYEALARRHPKSRSRGRLGAPAGMGVGLLILKPISNWSHGVLEREVRANLVYRDFTRVGAGKTPDAKTTGPWGVAVGPEVVKQIHQRLVQLAQANGLAAGRRMRVDTTVVETNVHYPTDSSLLGDGVRVLI